MNTLKSFAVPPITNEFYEALERTFRPIAVKPTTTMEEIQFAAGQQSVLTWVKHKVAGTSVIGTEDELPIYNNNIVGREDTSKKNIVHRLYNRIKGK